MLPPGHIAGGYLTAYALIKLGNPVLNEHQKNLLLLSGMFFGFAPDLDFFYAFFKVRSFTIQKNRINHHDYFTHTPFAWLVAGLIIALASTSPLFHYFGLLVWLGAWSHFILDSIEGHGIRWLWPLSNRYFSLFKKPKTAGIEEPGFIKFWIKFLIAYPEHLLFTFVCELSVIIIALTIYFK